jgi:small-conductance mechanosensitive channel
VKVVLDQVAAGRIQVPGIHPETVSATRRLISVVIWLFALSAAYPFLPGANSLAFKGISVFFGLMLTLGSTGVMTHAMSGLVLIYSRALRKGDWIRLADNEGQVSEIGVLATKILTRENYIVTVPNAVVVSGKIINLSAESTDGGSTSPPASPSATIRRGVRSMRCWSWRRDAPRGSISKLRRWCVSWVA